MIKSWCYFYNFHILHTSELVPMATTYICTYKYIHILVTFKKCDIVYDRDDEDDNKDVDDWLWWKHDHDDHNDTHDHDDHNDTHDHDDHNDTHNHADCYYYY